MAYSYTTYTGNGSTTQYAVAFGYIRREHVLATVAGSPVTFTWVNDSTIQMDAVPANGAAVRVYRVTPLAAPLVDFADGATLVAADLDTNARQSIYTQQELDDSLVDGLAGVIPNGDKGDITTSVGGSVWTIDNGAVTEAKVATGAITEAKVGAGAITEAKVGAGAITEAKVADGAVTTAKLASVIAPTVSSLNGGPLAGTRNRIINGDMRIDQRNGGASVTPTVNTYTIDRWVAVVTQVSKFSIQQNVGSVTPPAGFTNYLGITSLSAYTVAAGDVFSISQPIEGYNTSDLAWGSANARAVTLSFWVRSSLTGTFGGSVAGGQSYPFSYTITSANTWEYKTVSITGSTSGTWNIVNNDGLILRLSLGAGSTYSGTAGAWSGSDLYSATGATSVVGTNGATFYITGVQLETGTVATPFERRIYGQELALCQRYFQFVRTGIRAYLSNSGQAIGVEYNFVVPMRVAPTLTLNSTAETLNVATIVRDSITSIGFRFLALASAPGETTLREVLTAAAEL